MPDRDQQSEQESELQDLEDDARRSDEQPPGANPESPQHKSAKKSLDDAKSEGSED